MKNNRQTKKLYSPPITTIVELESELLLQAGSITGSATDSDDSEFGAPMQRRGEWGNLWNE